MITEPGGMMIELTDVTKTYGKKQTAFSALDSVSVSIPRGASVAIVGKSGSGKSTLMHIMSGLDRPTSGSVVVDGRDLARLKPKQVDAFRAGVMGFIFQAFFVEANETCFQNVSLSLELAGVPRAQRKAKVQRALELVDLGDKIDQKAKNLSGGQKQRLAIARAIVGEPKVLFADEPTGNLDSATGQRIEDLLFAFNSESQTTLVIVTHDEELAARCDMRIRIKDGALVPKKGRK